MNRISYSVLIQFLIVLPHLRVLIISRTLHHMLVTLGVVIVV